MAKGAKRERKRVPKDARKNLRLWAEGARETILAPHIDGYSLALTQGWRQERKYLKEVCKEFHARVSWRILDHEEPELEKWDPAAMISAEILSEDDARQKRERVKELNGRIRRWFTYRIRRLRKQRISAGLDPTKDPYAVLLAKLSGLSSPPKARQAFQQFMRESYSEKIAPVVAERWAAEQKQNGLSSERTKEPKAGFRAQVARQMFAALPQAEQKAIAERAKTEAQAAKASYAASLNAIPAQTPAVRQRCIEQISNFIGPILQGLNIYTGLHATLIVGGPMPTLGGELGTLHFSYGRNKTTSGAHWGQWDKPRFTHNVQNFMVEYLKTAFTPEDCLSCALPITSTLASSASDLAGAKYTIGGGADSDDSDSDSALGASDSELSDSDTDVDEDESLRTRKKRKVEGLVEKENGGAAKKRARKKASAKTSSDTSASITSNTSGSAPPASSSLSALVSSVPADNTPESTSAPVSTQTTPAEPEDESDDASDDSPAPAPPAHNPWHITEAERQRNIKRNQEALAALKVKEAVNDLFHPLKEARAPQPPRPKPKPLTVGALRRSQRHAGAGRGEDAEMPAATPLTGSMDLDVLSAATTYPVPRITASPTSTSDPPTSLIPATPPGTSGPSSLPLAPTPPLSTQDGVQDGAVASASTLVLPPLSQAAQMAVAMAAPSASPGSSATTSSLPPCPPDALPWFIHAHGQVTQRELGCHYHALLGAWIRVEHASRFENGPTNLSTKGRPAQVGNWVAALRGKRKCDVAVPNPVDYAVGWQQWWDSLQPKWRKKGEDGKWTAEGYGGGGREWGPLYQWGVNGMLNVVASLYFWGSAVAGGADSDLRTWEEAVGDVTWMMEGMALYYEMFKRKF